MSTATGETARRIEACRERIAISLGLAAAVMMVAAAPRPAGAGDVARGAKVYKTTCVACHGAKGDGVVPGTPDFTDPEGPLAQDDAVLFDRIKNGFQSPGSMMAMPPKGGNPSLSDDDIRAVIAYLRQAFGKADQK